MKRKPQEVPLKLLRAIGCHFLKRSHDSSREKAKLHWNDCIGTENTQEPVQIVYLNAYTKHKTNSIQPRAGFVIDFPKKKGHKESDVTE